MNPVLRQFNLSLNKMGLWEQASSGHEATCQWIVHLTVIPEKLMTNFYIYIKKKTYIKAESLEFAI